MLTSVWCVLSILIVGAIFMLLLKVFQKIAAWGCMGIILVIAGIAAYLYLLN